MNEYLPLIIWAVVIGGILLFLAQQGHLLKIRNYWNETREELRKCTWPTVEELKGHTVVVMLTIALLGAFTVCVDFLLSNLIRYITS